MKKTFHESLPLETTGLTEKEIEKLVKDYKNQMKNYENNEEPTKKSKRNKKKN